MSNQIFANVKYKGNHATVIKTKRKRRKEKKMEKEEDDKEE